METITRKCNGKMAEMPIYTLQEAKERGLQVVDWREARPGDWACSTDFYVSQCLRLHIFADRGKRQKKLITFPYGRIWVTKSARLNYLERRAAGNLNASSARTWQEQEARKTRTINMVKAYVAQIMAGKKTDYDQLGRIYRSDQLIPAATVRRVLKEAEVQKMIDEQLSVSMSDLGLTPQMAAASIRQALTIAEERKDAGALLRIAKMLAKLLDM